MRTGGGTLFLDEIGSLPLGGQMKLLRVLDTGSLGLALRARSSRRRAAASRWRIGAAAGCA